MVKPYFNFLGVSYRMHWQSIKWVRYQHLNAAGTLFGGKAMSWIDEQCAIFAALEMGTTRLVTAKISEAHFKNPGKLGDVLSIGVKLAKVGRTSITLECEIRNKTTGKTIVRVDEIVFVALDENGKPCRHKLTK